MTSRDRKMEKNIKRNVEEEERLHKGKVSCLRYSGKLVMAVCGTHKIKKSVDVQKLQSHGRKNGAKSTRLKNKNQTEINQDNAVPQRLLKERVKEMERKESVK